MIGYVYLIGLFLSLFVITPFIFARTEIAEDDKHLIICLAFVWFAAIPIGLIAIPSKLLFNTSVKLFTPKPKQSKLLQIDHSKTDYRNISFLKP